LPTSNEPTRGVQLKEGSFTFPPHYKCRVDVKALKEIPRKLNICGQGIESLNDLFYEAPPEQKEGVLTQKAIWENVLERVLDMKAFNASSSYTDLATKILPLRVLLPEERQYFPIDAVFAKEPTNPFLETKRFARELLDLVAAIKTLREEKVFGHPDFHVYPGKDAFVLTDTETGERRIMLGMYSIVPGEVEESVPTEQLSIMAIKDLIQQRWDKGQFRKILKANDLDTILFHLKKLAQDIPTWKNIGIKTGYAAVYSTIIFLAFSFLMTAIGYLKTADLEEMNLYLVKKDGENYVKTKLLPSVINVEGYKQDATSQIRILLEAGKRSEETFQVIGTYRSWFRLSKLGIVTDVCRALDKAYHLDYNSPMNLKEFLAEPQLKSLEIIPTEDEFTFRFKPQDKWDRERFRILSSIPQPMVEGKKVSAGPMVELETIIQRPKWTLEMEPNMIAFQEAVSQVASISTDSIKIYTNPTEDEKSAGAKVAEANLQSYFTVSFDRLGVPIQIHYLDPNGVPLAQMMFDSFEEGKLKSAPKLRSVKIGTKKKAEEGEEESETEDEEREEKVSEDRESKSSGKRTPVLPTVKRIDTFWLKRTDAVAQIALQMGFISKEQQVECVRIWRGTPGLEMEKILLDKNYINKKQHESILQKMQKNEEESAGETIQDVYYRLHELPKEVNAVKVVVLSRHLPSEEIKGQLHIAVPGISKPLSVPITFHPKQNIEFSPKEVVDIRDQVTGIAIPISLERRVWGESKKFPLHELQSFTFQIVEKAGSPKLDGFGAFSLCVQRRQDPDNLFFYNTATGETCKITEYTRKSGKFFFAAKPETYGKSETEFFETLDITNRNVFGIREAIAKTASQLYIIVLTDKNVEEASLILKWRGGEKAADLPISARSAETLKLVQWKADTAAKEIARYNPKDWIEKLSIEGPLGFAQYQAIIFSGEQPDKDVSSDVIVSIEKPELLNILYQTVDGDWFSHIPQEIPGVKILSKPSTQIKIEKIGKDKDQKVYFRPESKDIGRIEKYLLVPGRNVKPGHKSESVPVVFYYPQKDMRVSLDIAISCAESPKVDWLVKMDDDKKTLKIKVVNYPKAQAASLTEKFQFLSTCASIALLHSQYHTEWKASEVDQKFADTIRWSLESIGFHGPATPPSALGKLGDTIKLAIKTENEAGLKKTYEITKETLLFSWSQQAQSLLNYHLELDRIKDALTQGKSLKTSEFELNVQLQPKRELPPLVEEPERFVEIELSLPYDKLVLDKKTEPIVQLQDGYYYNIPKNFDSVANVKEMIAQLYPYPDVFPVQDTNLEKTDLKVSKTYYENILQYSLWEQRLKEFKKEQSEFWVAMLGVTSEITDVDGKIDTKEVNKIGEEIQKQLRTYFISPIEITRVFWSELKDKTRGEADSNRKALGKEEQSGILRFVERSMMSQLTDKKCWYTNFSFVVDRLMVDRCPYHQWIYIKTYRPTIEGYEGEEVKLRIFKRDGLSISPYPGAEYNVEILKDATEYTNLITVKGVTLFQDWFTQHPSNELKASKVENRLQVKFYYDDMGTEKELIRPGVGGPPIIDFEASPASVILFQVKGYHITPDRLRQLAREKDFTIKTTKGKTKWIWTFSFDNGPILVPFSYKIKKSLDDVIKITPHILNWKQDPPPAEEERNLVSLATKYDMEFLYINTQSQLPMSHFFPYNNFEDICKDYNQQSMSSNRMIDFLEKLFEVSDQIEKSIKFKWNLDLSNFYSKEQHKDQMFRYSYPNNHELRLNVPAIFEKPEKYQGSDHPQLQVAPGQRTAVIWRIVPSKTSQPSIQRGFPKYIMEKQYFPNSEPVFSKE